MYIPLRKIYLHWDKCLILYLKYFWTDREKGLKILGVYSYPFLTVAENPEQDKDQIDIILFQPYKIFLKVLFCFFLCFFYAHTHIYQLKNFKIDHFA